MHGHELHDKFWEKNLKAEKWTINLPLIPFSHFSFQNLLKKLFFKKFSLNLQILWVRILKPFLNRVFIKQKHLKYSLREWWRVMSYDYCLVREKRKREKSTLFCFYAHSRIYKSLNPEDWLRITHLSKKNKLAKEKILCAQLDSSYFGFVWNKAFVYQMTKCSQTQSLSLLMIGPRQHRLHRRS